MPTLERGLIAPAFGLLIVGAMTFQRTLAEELAPRAIDEAAWVVIILKVRLVTFVGRFVSGFKLQFRLLEVVVASCHTACAGFQAQLESLDDRHVSDQATALHISRGPTQLGEDSLVIAEDQHMPFLAVLEVVVNPLFLAQPLDEVQIGFIVLHAVIARRAWLAELKAVAVTLDAMLFQDQRDDLLRRHLLIDTLVGTVMQILQLRYQRQGVTRQALASVALGNAVDLPVDAIPLRIERQKRLLVQKRLQIDVGVFADQFQVETKRLADAFSTCKRQHLQVA
ncbi:hypothetical protein ALQ27_200017 [Pseudomonas syringae pv. delphinii]|nr:hypothetical protein ALQ27_200017 [Pseudomonas syringae pv. delphinii]